MANAWYENFRQRRTFWYIITNVVLRRPPLERQPQALFAPLYLMSVSYYPFSAQTVQYNIEAIICVCPWYCLFSHVHWHIIDCLPVVTSYYICKCAGFISKLHVHLLQWDWYHADHTINHLFAHSPNLVCPSVKEEDLLTYILTRTTNRPVNSDTGNVTRSYTLLTHNLGEQRNGLNNQESSWHLPIL